jgi:hypothetical protein
VTVVWPPAHSRSPLPVFSSTRHRPPSPLGHTKPDDWLAEYTTELLNPLRVLGRLVMLEPKQADLLRRTCAGPLIGVDRLASGGKAGAKPARPADDRQAELPT